MTLITSNRIRFSAAWLAYPLQLRQARITLYSVDPLGSNEGVGRTSYYQDFLKGVSKPNQVNVGDLSLQVLAVQSGGLALASNNDVASLLQKCLADTEAYYELSFVPAPGRSSRRISQSPRPGGKTRPNRTHPHRLLRATLGIPRRDPQIPKLHSRMTKGERFVKRGTVSKGQYSPAVGTSTVPLVPQNRNLSGSGELVVTKSPLLGTGLQTIRAALSFSDRPLL